MNSFVDPLIVLFFLRVNYGNLRTFEKFKKVKLRKYKMKRKKIRKLYVFRKLKRIVLFRNVKKRFYKQKSFTEIFYKFFTNSSSKVLVQRIPVSTRVIEATSVDFFYKLNKKRNSQLWEDFETVDEYQTDFLIYLRNYHQKPYHKLRKARIAH